MMVNSFFFGSVDEMESSCISVLFDCNGSILKQINIPVDPHDKRLSWCNDYCLFEDDGQLELIDLKTGNPFGRNLPRGSGHFLEKCGLLIVIAIDLHFRVKPSLEDWIDTVLVIDLWTGNTLRKFSAPTFFYGTFIVTEHGLVVIRDFNGEVVELRSSFFQGKIA